MEQGQVRRKAAGTSRIRKQRIRRRTADKRAGQIEGREQEIQSREKRNGNKEETGNSGGNEDE